MINFELYFLHFLLDCTYKTQCVDSRIFSQIDWSDVFLQKEKE